MDLIKIDENNNKIIGENPELINSHILFNGKNNRLICEKNVKLINSVLEFGGDNSIIYLSSNRNPYYVKISIFNNSVFFIDENNYINSGGIHCSLSEEKNILIGKEGLFSFGIWLRTADPHLLYDAKTMKRINLSKSIFIGDHVWLGQDILILKGTQIGSGSIIGAKSVVSNKKIGSNSLWAGVPVKKIRTNVLFDGNSVHSYTHEQTEKSLIYDKNQYVYTNKGKIFDFNKIDKLLNSINNVDGKIILLEKIRNFKEYNRFYINS